MDDKASCHNCAKRIVCAFYDYCPWGEPKKMSIEACKYSYFIVGKDSDENFRLHEHVSNRVYEAVGEICIQYEKDESHGR